MGKIDEGVCRYKHCLHDDRKLLKSESVKVGSQYYHKDCYKAKCQIEELIDYFVKELNPDVIYPVLVKTIDNICYPKKKKGISPDRLLFQVKYHCSHGHKIQYPPGLYYAIQDREAYEAYLEHKARRIVKAIVTEENSEPEDLAQSQMKKVRIQKQKGFEDILGG